MPFQSTHQQKEYILIGPHTK